MTSVLESLEFDLYTDEASIRLAAERIRASVGRTGLDPSARGTQASEQRTEPRFGYLTGAFLIAVKVDGGRARQLSRDEPRLPAITVDISLHGVGVQHVHPLMHRTHVLTCDTWTDKPVSLLVERRWTRHEDESVFGYRSGFAIRGVASERGIPLPDVDDQPVHG